MSVMNVEKAILLGDGLRISTGAHLHGGAGASAL